MTTRCSLCADSRWVLDKEAHAAARAVNLAVGRDETTWALQAMREVHSRLTLHVAIVDKRGRCLHFMRASEDST